MNVEASSEAVMTSTRRVVTAQHAAVVVHAHARHEGRRPVHEADAALRKTLSLRFARIVATTSWPASISATTRGISPAGSGGPRRA